jgi:hypothetical protein
MQYSERLVERVRAIADNEDVYDVEALHKAAAIVETAQRYFDSTGQECLDAARTLRDLLAGA